jgi:AcrR family transcriptional regulator
MSDKKALILKCGKELFSSKGFKETKVADITNLAKIATGSFYNYYQSKDTLFMEIFLEEDIKLKKKIIKTINIDAEPLTVINEMMLLNNQGMAENPILKEWYNKELYNKIEQNYRKIKGLDQMDFFNEEFIKIINKWQKEGKLRKDISAEMIMAIFSSLSIIDKHKDEVGLQYFPYIFEYLVKFVMNGLMDF